MDDIVFRNAWVAGTTPPSAPTSLTATASSWQVTLDWNDNTEPDLIGYNVYRSATQGGPYTKIANMLSSATSHYVDSAAVNNTTYYYVVTAFDSEANESDESNEASARPSTPTRAPRPTGMLSVPREVNYQGFVEVGGVPFDGPGSFKFAIVNSTGTLTLWSNDGTSSGGAEPGTAVGRTVRGGIFGVRLGDIEQGMTPLPPSAFETPDTWLQVWFSDGTVHGFQKLGPQQKLVTVPYAMMSQAVPDSSISGYNLQRESVWPEHAGRGNTVVSYYYTYSGSWTTANYTVPEGKTFVITDISFCVESNGEHTSVILVHREKGAVDEPVYKGQSHTVTPGQAQPCHITFRAGIPVGPGWTIKVRNYLSTTQHSATISGYEFSN